MATAQADRPTWRARALIDDLLGAIEADPTSIDAHRLLAEQYRALGWEDAATDVAKTISQLDLKGQNASKTLAKSAPEATRVVPVHKQTPQPDAHIMSLDELKEGYISLRTEASILLREMLVFQELAPKVDCSQQIAELKALTEGRMASVVRGKISNTAESTQNTQRSARSLAASMKADSDNAVDIAISDLENVFKRTRGGDTQPIRKEETDKLRETLRKRVDAVKSALPSDMARPASDAFMHIEHEMLKRSYANSETMLGDPVSDIPREMFWTSEDGYAWDMSELVQAMKVNKGSMRNPLTRENFTAADVEAIVRHPQGKELAAIQLEQSALFQGVRKDTIAKLESMAKILLEDDTENSHLSHNAVDEFLAYCQTLPAYERKAVDELRVPAKDSHTGQTFDDTIGDAVRDAKGNRICFHKAGDLIKQAAAYLNQGSSS